MATSLAEPIREYHFNDEIERQKARLLAVEALLAYGGHYNGSTKPDGLYRVEEGGRIYTKKDFGIA